MSWGICSGCQKYLSGLIAVFAFAGLTHSVANCAETRAANIVVSSAAAPPIKFGVEELRRALDAKGVKATMSAKESTAGVQIIVVNSGDRGPAGVGGGNPGRSARPESYVISVPSSNTIRVEGSDPTGTMYGAMDLAEKIGWASDNDFVRQIKPAAKTPYLPLRGVNMFPTTQDIDDPNGAFWSDDYWKGYLDQMARNRYNLLDLHGPCDAVTLTFPNGFGYFVSLPEYPQLGVGPEKAAKNLARFRQIIRMAADRGIKVAYMNYEASPTVGPWKTRRWGTDERWASVPQEFLEGPQLEDYTRKAVLSFLKQLPDLWMFGFRVGESGQPEDFYKKTYLAALAELPESLNVYVRTWIADPQKVREIANSTQHHLYIEPKYNGEQLGLPYQAALGGRQYAPSGSYEDYTDYPRKYSILWQIRAHGTHRVFYWGSPEFARRTVRSCKFGDGVGFSMEPMEAYTPAPDYLHNNPKTDHSFYKWMFERQWLWHLTWGRTAYDPDVSEKVWIGEFGRRFGAQAGPIVYQAVVESSRIVPFIYSYHNVGLDHQDFAAEFETGDHAFGARGRLWQGTRLVPYGGNNDGFLRVTPLDRTAMADPASYVEDHLNHVITGRMTPFEAASYLGSSADDSERAIEAASRLNPGSPKEFDCIQQDVHALAWLARYYRDRILSATHFAFYRRTYHHPELTAAGEYLQQALADWDRLSDVTEQHYGYLPELIRMGLNKFRWRDEGRSLGIDWDQINTMETEFRRLRQQYGYRTILGHVPAAKVKPGEPLELTVTHATQGEGGNVYLFYRNSPGVGYRKVAMRPLSAVERTWSVVIPANEMAPGKIEYYFEANEGTGGNYGGTLEHRPPYCVLVTEENSRPVITHDPPQGTIRGPAVTLAARVQSKSKIEIVHLYYKPMPAAGDWVRFDMTPAGRDQFTASIPLTAEGILYYFEAVDEDGNAANYPDFRVQTPYFAVGGWDPNGQ